MKCVIRNSDFLSHLLLPLSRFNGRVLRKRRSACATVEQMLILARYFRGYPPISGLFNLGLGQIDEEIYELARLIQSMKPMTVCEIGTASGGTLLLFSTLCPLNATIISIDLPGGPYGGGYPKFRTSFYNSFARKEQRLFLLRTNSHSRSTLRAVEKILGRRRLEFLFIDGDHTYAGVKRDFDIYSSLIESGHGMVALHDIVEYPADPTYGVCHFWNELKHSYRTKEIVSNPRQIGYGIGVVYF